nr:pullulanase-type alpha-1,6-glucosidase [uncultured Friedmanniella sp.]
MTPIGIRPRIRTALVGLTVAALAAAALPGQQAAADHTPLPATVTLVGSLQSELGCPGDWQPECDTTTLAAVAGEPGVFRGTFTVPAGNFEYKVAIGGSFAENYGAGGAPGGANIAITAPGGEVTFSYDHSTHQITDSLPRSVTAERAAHWVRRDLLAWNLPDERAGFSYRLYWAAEGGLTNDDGTITGGSSARLRLRGSGLPASVKRDFPHLATYEALRVPRKVRERLRTILTGQVAVAAFDRDGKLVAATGVQLPGVLDDVYRGAQRRKLGPTWRRGRPTVAVWAPTAKKVTLLLDPAGAAPERRVAMRRTSDGVWRVRGRAAWRNARYLYEVRVYAPTTGTVVVNRVTDPYSVALTTNSQQSVLANLNARALKPSGWNRLAKPALPKPEDSSIYELHVRDFSVSDETVPAAHRGSYLAFTHRRSDGMRHLRQLARSGLNTVHLLPVNDIASIEERRSEQQEPACDLDALPPDSEAQQECVAAVAERDAFNWGYDPLHFTTPEGSYATNSDGTARTRQFRRMVKGLNEAGLRVVIDVVYNHTPAAGQDPKSILDRVVPGYYQRLNPSTGQVETSTCCQNTATEHAMMEKLMVESLVTWAKAYKVDGFRFDLMGHQPKSAMLKVRRALDKLTLAEDGVDGRSIYLYGEGWNFGEVADNARFEQATQRNMAGTGIGTFNDRLRDAVRGGGPFDENPRIQGFASGQYTDPNGDPVNGSAADQRNALLLNQDRIKVGLTGNLRDYRFVDRTGATVTGADVDYNGQPTGYTTDPQEAVNYVEAHDNETLYDALIYKLPADTPMADRIRMQTLALSTTAFSQGVSFWHAGGEMLRSKSLDRNSYDSGDWFNILDYSYQTNGFGRGLPPRRDNESKWPYMRPLLANPELAPSERQIRTAKRQARSLLRIRESSPLFHLGTEALVQQKVSFPMGGPEQTPGVIVMRIDDTVGPDVDRARKGLVVVFNASDETTTQTLTATAGKRYRLHPVQADGSDRVVQAARHHRGSGRFTVPARTVAVFVQR